MLTKTRDVVENICMPPKLPQHIRQMDANGPYHHISTSRPIKQAPPKNVTKSLMCCMFPSPENLPYRHLYLDGIAWQWGGKPFNTGVARETPKMSSKTSNPLKIWGEAGEHQKKNTHTKKTIDWGKKRTWKKHQQKQGPSWSQHLWHWRRRPKSHRLSPSAQLMCDVDQLVSFKGEVLLHWISVSNIATPVCRTCWVYLDLLLLSYIYSHTVCCLVVIVLTQKVNSLT